MNHSLSNPSTLVTTFTVLDDLNALLQLDKHISGRHAFLNLAEVATISLIRREYDIQTWDGLYNLLVQRFQTEFHLPVYKNFVATMNRSAKPLLVLINILLSMNRKKAGRIKLIDSTTLPVCKNYRIKHHKTMKSVATRSKSSLGWFYGLKLHALTDMVGNILELRFTTGNVGDRKILDVFLEKLHDSVIIADAGYLSPSLEQKAGKNNNILLTCMRKNMTKLASFLDICLLNLRPRIEVLFSVLKERLGLVTSLPRSVNGYLAHYIHVIFGYLMLKAIS